MMRVLGSQEGIFNELIEIRGRYKGEYGEVKWEEGLDKGGL